jgi:predicted MFS family arabinose efflux permease
LGCGQLSVGGEVGQASPAALGVVASAREIFRAPGIGWLYLAGTVRFLAGFTIMTFVPEFYRRAFPRHAAAFAALNALAIGAGGLLSSYAGGRIVDVVRPGTQRLGLGLGFPSAPAACCRRTRAAASWTWCAPGHKG